MDPRIHIDGGTRRLERGMGDWARRRLPGWLAELVMFTLKQGWAALFGGLLLVAILATKAVWQPSWPIARYDFLVVFALATQVLFLWARLETWEEAKVIALFHLTGTAMLTSRGWELVSSAGAVSRCHEEMSTCTLLRDWYIRERREKSN